MTDIPKSHPRYQSLMLRERLIAGFREGLCSEAGLIAHGRGEAFDYLLGEKTHDFARDAIAVASAHLHFAKHPILSVNGNVASLAAAELAALAKRFPRIGLEVNLFHYSAQRSAKIADALKKHGAPRVFEAASDRAVILAEIEHQRKFMHPEGIAKADVVLVALEDGDRCQALVKSGRTVIAIDLNPMSRTPRLAQIPIVDELTRCLPVLEAQLTADESVSPTILKQRLAAFDAQKILQRAEAAIRSGS